MVDILGVIDLGGVFFVGEFVKEYGIVVVFGSSFYCCFELGWKVIWFVFCKMMDFFEEGVEWFIDLWRE